VKEWLKYSKSNISGSVDNFIENCVWKSGGKWIYFVILPQKSCMQQIG
jgi:hypothetical protein